MKNIALIVVSLFFVLGSPAEPGIFIGNSGDGVLLNKKIYLYDLYESDLHLKPYFGDTVSVRIQQHAYLTASLKSLGINEDLLLKKLTDAEKLKNGLGVYLMQVISRYQWIFTGLTLPLLPDKAPVGYIERLSLARRVHGSIFIDSERFNQMDAQNKVALIVHEAVSSLLRPVCEDGICEQKNLSSRLLTARLFNAHSFNCEAQCLGYDEDLLAIDPQIVGVLETRIVADVKIPQGIMSSFDLRLKPLNVVWSSQLGFRNEISAICRKYLNLKRKNPSAALSIYLYRAGYIVQSQMYTAREAGTERSQLGTMITGRAPFCAQENLKIDDVYSCELELSRIIPKYFSPNDRSENTICSQVGRE